MGPARGMKRSLVAGRLLRPFRIQKCLPSLAVQTIQLEIYRRPERSPLVRVCEANSSANIKRVEKTNKKICSEAVRERRQSGKWRRNVD